MRTEQLRMTAHVFRRLVQRGISLATVQLTLRRGRRIHRAHTDFIFMGKRDIPRGHELQFDSVLGAMVVLENGFIVTCSKNKNVAKNQRREELPNHSEDDVNGAQRPQTLKDTGRDSSDENSEWERTAVVMAHP